MRTFLRARRLALGMSIGDVVAATGLARGEVSMLERGYALPRADQAQIMAAVYGDPGGWYPAGVRAVLDDDLDRRVCPGCGEPLDPDASRARRYHGPACRSRARRERATRPGGRAAV